MQHLAKHKHPLTLLYEYFGNIGIDSNINAKNDYDRVTLHSHHRVGYDGQDKILSAEYAFIVLCALLFVSFNGDQNTFTSSEAQSRIQWNGGCLQKNL